jgi:hypothetical protein
VVACFVSAVVEPLGGGVDVEADNRRYFLDGIKLTPVSKPGEPAPAPIELKPGAQLSLCLTGERDEHAPDDRPVLTRVELASPYSALKATMHQIQLFVRPIADAVVSDRAFPIGDVAQIDSASSTPSAVVAEWMADIRRRATTPQQPPPPPLLRQRSNGHRHAPPQTGSHPHRKRQRRGTAAVTPTAAPVALAITPALASQLAYAAHEGAREGVQEARRHADVRGEGERVDKAYQLALLATLLAAKASEPGVQLLASAINQQNK